MKMGIMKKIKYSVIVFDLGNVLIPFDYSIIIKRLNDVEEGLGDSFYKRYQSDYHVHRQLETWELSTDDFLDIMMEWTKYKISKEEFCDIYSNIFTVNKDVAALLPELKKKYKLVLLSNTNYIHQKYGWEKYPFLNYFDKLILSHEVGAIKPQKEIYKAVENFTQESANEHIFIDDVLDYVNGAKACGWDGIQFLNYENLTDELKFRKIL